MECECVGSQEDSFSVLACHEEQETIHLRVSVSYFRALMLIISIHNHTDNKKPMKSGSHMRIQCIQCVHNCIYYHCYIFYMPNMVDQLY